VFMKKISIKKKFLIQISDLRQSRPLRGAFLIPPALPEVADLDIDYSLLDIGYLPFSQYYS